MGILCSFVFFFLLYPVFRTETARTQDSSRCCLSCPGPCLCPRRDGAAQRRMAPGRTAKILRTAAKTAAKGRGDAHPSICPRMWLNTSTSALARAPARLLKLCLTSSPWWIILLSSPCLNARSARIKVATTWCPHEHCHAKPKGSNYRFCLPLPHPHYIIQQNKGNFIAVLRAESHISTYNIQYNAVIGIVHFGSLI